MNILCYFGFHKKRTNWVNQFSQHPISKGMICDRCAMVRDYGEHNTNWKLSEWKKKGEI